MKSSTRFFGLLITILIMAACSDNPAGNSDFQPYRVGTWLVTSPTSAQWQGHASVNTKAAFASSEGDTLYYGQPNGNALEIEPYPNGEEAFNLAYTDSMMTKAFFDTTSAAPEITWIDSLQTGSGGIGYKNGFFHFESKMKFSCDSTFTLPNGLIKIGIQSDDGGLYRLIKVDAQGLYQAANDLVCHR